MNGWVKLRGDGAYCNLAHATLITPTEISAGVWRPRVSPYGLDIETDPFATAADCSAFIAEFVHGFDPE